VNGGVPPGMPRPLLVLAIVLVTTGPVAARPADDWLAGLTDRVIADLGAGKPLVVEVHVPLCDSSIIACGNAKLGDGDNPDTNLYWSTTPGFGSWFARRGGGWTRVLKQDAGATGDRDVVAVHVYRRTIAAPAAWRKRGAPKHFELDVVIHGWRGKAIDRALAAYADDVSGRGTRELVLADGAKLAAGGAAQLVAFVGHNRLMDLDHFTWPAAGTDAKGAIAIACDTAPYMKAEVPAATRVPLLLTSDFLFANAAPLEAAVLAFARGGGYAAIRKDAATAYAGVQRSTLGHVLGAFTNPSDRRW
jgi:hypothetical protein